MATGTAAVPTFASLPLVFAFNRNPGLYLPLIALQYHEVKLIFEFNSAVNNVAGAAQVTLGTSNPVTVFANYVYLDTEERRRFAQNKHEYLIDQLQIQNESFTTTTGGQNNTRLNFNHPVKYLAWIVNQDETSVVARGNFSNSAAGGVLSSLAGYDRHRTWRPARSSFLKRTVGGWKFYTNDSFERRRKCLSFQC